MHSSIFVSLLALAGFCSASPLVSRSYASDDVILLDGEGGTKVMKLAEYEATLKKIKREESMLTSPSPAKNPFRRRGCQESTETQVLKDETIIHDDVVMSPILENPSGAVARVMVTKGYSIGNSITTTAESGIEEIGFSLSLAVSVEWSTTQDQAITFEVPSGKYGLIVSQPSVRRRTGKYYSGCTDNPDVADFVADEFSSQKYGSLSWVSGVIRLCMSDTYPVPYCVGDGVHR